MPITKTRAQKASEKREKQREWEKGILGRQIDSTQVLRELESCIESSKDAKEAIVALTKAGCVRSEILLALYQYCGGDPDRADEVKRVFASHREFLLKLSRSLRRAADDVETAKSYLSDMGFDAPYQQEFSDAMRSEAGFLERFAKKGLKSCASRRSSGRDHYIVWLADMIKKTTGREHYQELTSLIHTIRLAYDPNYNEMVTPQTLRALVNRNKPLDLAFLDSARIVTETPTR
jgi:hypothetical protein